MNCRTCIHSTPELDGNQKWTCALSKQILPVEPQKYGHNQRQGCNRHLYIPQLVPVAKAVDASEKENWIQYERPDGSVFYNRDEQGERSKELGKSGATAAPLKD